MPQMGIGQLGLPIIGIQPEGFPGTYTWEIMNTYLSAVRELPVGKAIMSRLESDERVCKLLGKMLSNGMGGSRLSDATRLAQWYLWRANLVGDERTEKELEDFLNAEHIVAIATLWIYGLGSAQPTKVTDSIQLLSIESIQDSPEKEEFLRSNSQLGKNATPPAPAAALTKEYLVSKIVPDRLESSFELHSQSTAQVHAELFAIATVLNCLPGVCCVPGYSTSYLPPSVPAGPFSGSGGGTPIFDVLPHRRSEFRSGQETLATALLRSYEAKPPQIKDRLQRAMFRLAQAKGRLDDGDKALDLGIALEMLLLNSEHNGQELPGQLNLHFRLRGSWLIGIDATERRSIYRALGKLYAFRSQIAHNGHSDELMKMDYTERQAALTNLIGIAERIFQKILLVGVPRDWASLILGNA
jgi:Apea-like HEPN